MPTQSPQPAAPSAASVSGGSVTIYHNNRCSTSRKTLALLSERGIDPLVVDYLKNPPSRAALKAMIGKAGLTVRGAIREKEAIYTELALAQADDAALLDAMVAHPILINRPFVVTERGARLCRPIESVLEILP